MAVKESGGGEMPYGTAVEGSFGAAGVNGSLSSLAFDVSCVKGRKMTAISQVFQKVRRFSANSGGTALFAS